MMNDVSRVCVAVIAGAILLGWAEMAAANCARPVTYNVLPQEDVEGQVERVRVCPRNFDNRGCDTGSVLLRENVETGEVVALGSEFCSDAKPSCFDDPCPAAGTYRYGFEEPYECQSSACSTDYYGGVSVENEAECSDEPPPEYDGEVPWGDDHEICTYNPGGSEGCSVAGDATWSEGLVFVINGVVLLAGWAVARNRREG